MNEVEALPQMMLQQVANDVMLRINDVALRANGEVAVCIRCSEIGELAHHAQSVRILAEGEYPSADNERPMVAPTKILYIS